MTDPAAPSLLALAPAELAAFVVARGGQPFHARILRENVVGKGLLDYEAMTSLPAALRAALAAELPILSGRELARSVAADGTTKLLIGFARGADGAEATVETVHMPSLWAAGSGDERDDGADAPGKGATVCVSTQVGCPVACPFCASGMAGLARNLESHEIVEQFLRARALGPLARAVVMGIGEPFLNWSRVAPALAVVHDELGLGARKVTVSTVGFPERLARVARSNPRFQLAISLHSPFDEERAELVPAMRGVPVEDVLRAGDDWFEVTGREVTYEVVLLGGKNDDQRHAAALAARLARRRCTVNLIPFNPVDESPWKRPARATIDAFQQRLADAGVVATVRWSRGVEADAACGQLRARRG